MHVLLGVISFLIAVGLIIFWCIWVDDKFDDSRSFWFGPHPWIIIAFIVIFALASH